MSNDFKIKDSGKREEFSGGMVRDTTEGKTNWALIADGPMLERWAKHMTNGAVKYAKRNWMKAEGQEELDRAKESAFRHFMQWYYGVVDEDHASAVYFNINEAEYVKEKLKNEHADQHDRATEVGKVNHSSRIIQGPKGPHSTEGRNTTSPNGRAVSCSYGTDGQGSLDLHDQEPILGGTRYSNL